jgi:hypothetical protein
MRAALRYIAFESTIAPTIAACYRKYSDKYSKVDIVHDLTLVLYTLWTIVQSWAEVPPTDPKRGYCSSHKRRD